MREAFTTGGSGNFEPKFDGVNIESPDVLTILIACKPSVWNPRLHSPWSRYSSHRLKGTICVASNLCRLRFVFARCHWRNCHWQPWIEEYRYLLAKLTLIVYFNHSPRLTIQRYTRSTAGQRWFNVDTVTVAKCPPVIPGGIVTGFVSRTSSHAWSEYA